MKRKDFIKNMVLFPLSLYTMKLKDLNRMVNELGATEKMPVLFLGHGSPMNAIEENEFVTGFRNVAKDIPKPKAILCISAHWETAGTFVTSMDFPKTIHDFSGFPHELFQVQYPAPGNPDLAMEIQSLVKSTNVGLDDSWGLDHGAWSVIKHLFPNADIPVLQFSLNYRQNALYHYELAKELNALRHKGVLIIGSGNMVHNLGMVAWNRLHESFAFDWAQEANDKMKNFILKGDHQSMINFQKQGKAFDLAIPTAEHFLPLLYTLSLKEENENLTFFNDKPIAGALTMTSLKIH